MSGHQRHAQITGRQHHHHLFGMGQLRKELGMAGKCDATVVDHALVHRRCDHAGEVAVHAALAGSGQGFEHETAIGFIEPAGHYRRFNRRVPDIQTASGGGDIRPCGGCDGNQANGHAQLRGPLGKQVTAGNGNQGTGLGLRGEQQAKVRTNAGRLAGCQGETLGFHLAA